MATCELCGKSFRNTQGLSGHVRFKHGLGASPPPFTGLSRAAEERMWNPEEHLC